MFGYPPDLSALPTLWAGTDPADHATARQRIQAHLNGQSPPERLIYNGVRRDGSRLRFEVSVSAVLHQGQPAIQGILRDVTEQERLERQVQHAQKMEAVGTLAGGVAHEFNNILMVMGGYAQLLGKSRQTDPQTSEYARKISQSVKRAAELTKSLLSFSRRESSERAPINLTLVVEGVLKLFTQTFPPHIKIQTALSPQLPSILANPNQVEQVVLNLALNARDAMPQGGTLSLSTQLTDLEQSFCQTYPWAQPGRYVELRVEDTGQGMDPEVLEHVFEPFFTTKKPGQGTGLGLAVVYSIVKAHGGYIVAESHPGQGTRLRVLFPLREGLAAPAGPGVAREAALAGQGRRVLVVDDEPSVRDICSHVLKEAGFVVDEATQGEEGVQLFQQAHQSGRTYDLVIMDLVMPVLDGHLAILRLRELVPEVKVLVATGHGQEQGKAEELASLTQGILSKPFTLQALRREVARILGLGAAAPGQP